MSQPPVGLAIGALAGGLLVLAGALWPSDRAVEAGSNAAAIVNGQTIPIGDVEIALEAMARDSRNPLSDDAAEHALSRLIDEELLFQRAIALDLPRNASTVRRTIVMTMIDLAQSNDVTDPEDAELQVFFNANSGFFSTENRYRISWESAASESGERTRPPAHPPGRLLTPSDLRRYLGEDLTLAVLIIAEGETAGPIETGGRFHWLTVSEIASAEQPQFEANRDRVEALWRQRAAEASLEAYIAELREQADIRVQAIPGE
ncbi:MAG: hypothetical protein DHS20C06_14080 [Hyphobacterium sp.]|nr:MAG: hypothetical protein DHS20C06_14080 [Hyphobacterium sp.]